MHINNASAALIIDQNNQLLLQKRNKSNNIFFPNFWGLFGGASEINESPLECLIREIKEEIGWSVQTDQFKIQNLGNFVFNFPDHHFKNINRWYYQIICNQKNLPQIKLNEGQGFKFLKIDEVLKLKKIVPYDHFFLSIYFKKFF